MACGTQIVYFIRHFFLHSFKKYKNSVSKLMFVGIK